MVGIATRNASRMADWHIVKAAALAFDAAKRPPSTRSGSTVPEMNDTTAPAGATAGPLPRTRDQVRAYVKERGVEFLFAQFVDMTGKPNAKPVPAHHLDDLFESGAGFAGFAAGDIGQRPSDPDLEAMPDPASFT